MIGTTVPEELKGEVTGLMGNFDGNKTNEYILQNGTILDSGDTDTERKISHNVVSCTSPHERHSNSEHQW
jgi:hypothetical protein